MRLLGKALTFDDVLLVPAYSQVLPKDTQLSTLFSRNIALNLPLVSAAMDTDRSALGHRHCPRRWHWHCSQKFNA
jgi:IMP dehydrogenase/GMP reductase